MDTKQGELIELEELKQRVSRILAEKKFVACNILRIAKKGKNSVRYIIDGVLQRYGLERLHDFLFFAAVELIFNGIKANYKYILMIDEIKKLLATSEKKNELNNLKTPKGMYELILKYKDSLDIQKINERVRRILSDEEQVSKIAEKAEEEGRPLTSEEKKLIRQKLDMMIEAQQRGFRVLMAFTEKKDYLIMDIL